MQILIIDDDPDIGFFFETVLQDMGCKTRTAARISEAKALNETQPFDLILLDLELPDGSGLDIMPELIDNPGAPEVIIITGTGDVVGAEMAFKYGAWDYVRKPFHLNDVSLPIQRALKYRQEKLSAHQRTPLVRSKIVGESAGIRNCLEEVRKAASSDAGVVVTGETGTGKELFARAIHENSNRGSKPFVPIDCTVLTETLIESTLFGHEKGAFTGADTKQDGLIVQADGGTLMLDEIGDMPLPIQKKLLRTLQERAVRRVGGRKEIPVDVRLISATNVDLDKRVKQNRFREDLLYRIRAMELHVPPLRERDNDVELIALKKTHELSRYYNKDVKALSSDFLKILSKNHWPGNVRELINVLEYALASAGNDLTLVPKHLPPAYRLSGITFESSPPTALNVDDENREPFAIDEEHFPQLNKFRESMEKSYLKQLMTKTNGDRTKACKLSGISQARLYALLKKYDLPGFSSYTS